MTRFAADARKFVSAYARVISQSAPHIYLSALPFAPEQSLTSQQYLPQFPNTISLLTGKAASWPAILHVLTGHSDAVTSVSFSPDGKQVVSGSYDSTICIWDIETGDMVSGPFRGHDGWVMSVSFSPDGKRVVSGSYDKTIRIWDVEMGDMVSGPFPDHNHGVKSPAPFHDNSHMQDGWILGANSESLFWVPPMHRKALWRPSNVCVIGPNSTRLEFSRFVHGTSWRRCRK